MKSSEAVPAIMVGVMIMIAGPVAMASTCPSSMPAPKRYMCLQTESQMLKLQLAIANTKKQISNSNSTASRSMTSVKKEQARLPVPGIIAIYGMSKLTAVLQWKSSDGQVLGTVPVSKGSITPGGWTVQDITPSTVVVSRHGTAITLLMSASSSSNTNNGSSTQDTPGDGDKSAGNTHSMPPVFDIQASQPTATSDGNAGQPQMLPGQTPPPSNMQQPPPPSAAPTPGH